MEKKVGSVKVTYVTTYILTPKEDPIPLASCEIWGTKYQI